MLKRIRLLYPNCMEFLQQNASMYFTKKSNNIDNGGPRRPSLMTCTSLILFDLPQKKDFLYLFP